MHTFMATVEAGVTMDNTHTQSDHRIMTQLCAHARAWGRSWGGVSGAEVRAEISDLSVSLPALVSELCGDRNNTEPHMKEGEKLHRFTNKTKIYVCSSRMPIFGIYIPDTQNL